MFRTDNRAAMEMEGSRWAVCVETTCGQRQGCSLNGFCLAVGSQTSAKISCNFFYGQKPQYRVHSHPNTGEELGGAAWKEEFVPLHGIEKQKPPNRFL